jgi:hypothetical protein
VKSVRSVADISATTVRFLFVALSGMTITWLVIALGAPTGVTCGLMLLSLAAARPPRRDAILARPGRTRR